MKNRNSKKEIGMVKAINDSVTESLAVVYNKCSTAKWRAFLAIKETYNYLKGHNFRITSAGSWRFSCGFFYSDQSTGVLRCRYYTGQNVYDFEVMDALAA